MKRIFNKPLPRTYGDFKHFQSRHRPENPKDLPSFIIATVCIASLSSVTLLCCVCMWVIAALQGEPFSTVETHLYVGLYSAGTLALSVLVWAVWNRFCANK